MKSGGVLLFLRFGIILFILKWKTVNSSPTLNPPSINFHWWQSDDDLQWKLIPDLPDPGKEEFFIDVGNNTFTFGESANALIVNCTAPYPVEWVSTLQKGLPFTGLLGVLTGMDILFFREFGDINDVSTYKYTSTLKLTRRFKEITGNYSCQSVDGNSKLRKSMFMFVEGENRAETLILAGKKIEIVLEDKRDLVFPCIVSSPDETVSLQKHNFLDEGFAEYNEWAPVIATNSVTFDPKIGFTIKVSEFIPSEVLGSYRCLGISEEDVIFIDVVASQIKTDSSLTVWKATLQSPASINFISSDAKIECCSNTKTPPTLVAYSCFSIHHCKLLDDFETKTLLDPIITTYSSQRNGSCSVARTGGFMSRVLCLGDGVNVNGLLVIGHTNTTNITQSRFAQIVFNPKTEKVANEKLIGAYVAYGRIRGYEPISQFTFLSDGQTFDVYTKQDLSVLCQCSSYAFAVSVSMYLSVVFRNGTNLVFVNPPLGDNPYQRVVSSAVLVYLTFMNPAEVKSFTCHCPFWNDPGWKTATFLVNAKQSAAPNVTILGPNELHWALNSTDTVIQCQAEGLPLPTITWKKDGKEIATKKRSRVFNITNLSENGTSLLRFIKVPMSVHGEYTCTASNLLGTASKSVNVFVEEIRSSLVYWTAAILIVFVCILLAIVIAKTQNDNTARRPFQETIE